MSDDEPTTRGTEAARWQRVLLKLSGEAFAGPLEHGIHGPTVRAIAEDIVAAARQFNVDIAVVVENCPHTLLKLSVAELKQLVERPEVAELLQHIADWEFDPFAFVEATQGNGLVVAAYHLIDHYGLIDKMRLSRSRLASFLHQIQEGYRGENPYHNATHAADVAATDAAACSSSLDASSASTAASSTPSSSAATTRTAPAPLHALLVAPAACPPAPLSRNFFRVVPRVGDDSVRCFRLPLVALSMMYVCQSRPSTIP